MSNQMKSEIAPHEAYHVNKMKNQRCQWYDHVMNPPSSPEIRTRFITGSKPKNSPEMITEGKKQHVQRLGWEIGKKNKVCHWYSFQTSVPSPPGVHREGPGAVKANSVDEKILKEEHGVGDADGNDIQGENIDKGLTEKTQDQQEQEKDLDNRKPEVQHKDVKEEEEENVIDQLKAIRQQQQEILRRQMILNGEIKQNTTEELLQNALHGEGEGQGQLSQLQMEKLMKHVKDGGKCMCDAFSADSLASDMKLKVNATRDSSPKAWRLKGSFAKNLAIRDEGTVGELLWSDPRFNIETQKSSFDSSCVQDVWNKRRQRLMKEDSSENVFQLLSRPELNV